MGENFKIGSLFDGSGGFPLAAFMCGGSPVWASEIEPYPIAVTKSRFPYMKHLGSITDIKGNEIEPVDVISFGSPCQDLSVAGKRAGLKHEDNGDEETTRSGLFMDAVRIIKEMRKATNGKYPTFALWENVPGAFSSNRGEDFRIVLEELIKIVEPTAVMPPVPKAGWAYADSYSGNGWSLAYRVLDAQFWGVPQRRRRIYLVLDLRGERAREVLFEREGVRGYFAESRTPWKETPRNAENCSGAADCAGNSVVPYTLKIRSGCEGGGKGALIQEDMSATLATNNDQYLFQPVTASAGFCPEQSAKTRGIGFEEEMCPTLRAGVTPAVVCEQRLFQPASIREENWSEADAKNALRAGESKSSHVICKAQYLFENHSQDARYRGPLEVSPMLPAQLGTGGNNQPLVVSQTVYESHPQDSRIKETGEISPTVSVKWHKGAADTPLVVEKSSEAVCYGISSFNSNAMLSDNPHSGIYEAKTSRTLDLNGGNPACNQGGVVVVEEDSCYQRTVGSLCARDFKGVGSQYVDEDKLVVENPVSIRYIVRRLTPTECARLQGFPDKWGHPDKKDDFSKEEYRFWLNVRNTHAAINGKAVKEYSKEQMLKWYSKLHTDSSEYKMWGNGIALPCALYVMQGIADCFKTTINENEHPTA